MITFVFITNMFFFHMITDQDFQISLVSIEMNRYSVLFNKCGRRICRSV